MKFRKSEEAVSPVIGVILMVAITVILAAVIAAFVFGMGPPKQAPVSSIRLASVNTTAADSSIKLDHQGGADITLSDVKLIVEQGNYRATWTQVTTGTDKFNAGDTLRVYVNGAKTQITNNTNVGLAAGTNTTSFPPTTGIATASEVTVTMVDIPSGQQIAQGKIRT